MTTNAWLTMTALAALLGSTAHVAAQPAETDPLAKIGHIVVIFEENRSFDNFFGHFPGANGLANAGDKAAQIGPDGKPYELLPAPINSNLKPPDVDNRFPGQLPNRPFEINRFVPLDDDTGDLIHAFYQEQMQINGGAMNRYAEVSNAKGLVMGYFDISETYLWDLAKQFTLDDAMFHSAFGGSFLNHAFLVCSCAFRWPGAPEAIVARLDENGNMVKDGQVSPDGYAINTSRSVYLHAPGDTDPSKLVPPQTMPHIGDRLDARNVSWKWYSGGYDDAMAGHPDARFQFHHQPLQYFQDLAPGTPAQKAHLQDYKDLLRDIEQNTLPQVVFYKPIGQYNQHPGYTNVIDGDRHLAELVPKLQHSPAYGDMLIIITWDENGGQWDHVAPPRRDNWGPGTRIPLVAVGPTVKRGHIEHTPYDFGSILRTIEVRFGLEPLDDADRDAYPMRDLLQ
jgi:phospholipase C